MKVILCEEDLVVIIGYKYSYMYNYSPFLYCINFKPITRLEVWIFNKPKLITLTL